VSRARRNLISLGKLYGSGYVYRVDRDKLTMWVKKDKKLVLKGRRTRLTCTRCMWTSLQVELKRKRQQDQPGQPSPMRIPTLAHANEQQEETKFNVHICLRGDDDLQFGDIFVKVEIVSVKYVYRL
jgi:hypothetical protein